MKKAIAFLNLYGGIPQDFINLFRSEYIIYDLFLIDGKLDLCIKGIGNLSDYDYLIAPVHNKDVYDLNVLLERLRVPDEKRIFVVDNKLSFETLSLLRPYLTDEFLLYLKSIEYKNRIDALKTKISNTKDKRNQSSYSLEELYNEGKIVFNFIGFDQSSVKILYGGFGQLENTRGIFLNPWSEDRAGELEGLIDYLNGTECEGHIQFFIIYARVYETWPEIVEILRLQSNDCEIAVYYGDLISKHRITPEEIRKVGVSYIFSFDELDASRHGIDWLQEPLSNLPNSTDVIDEQYDVMFAGEAKDRLNKLLLAYENMRSHGLKCNFYIFRVKKEDMKYSDDIKYNMWLEYDKLIEIDRASACLLEIMQGGDSYSPTTRYSEAKLLKKKLITNCPALKDSKDKNIIWFSNIEEIDIDRIKEPYVDDLTDYKSMFSIDRMISSIMNTVLNEEAL